MSFQAFCQCVNDKASLVLINPCSVMFQLMKDMVSVSEATDWSRQTSTQSKYRALRCQVTAVQEDSAEFETVKDNLLNSIVG